MGPGEVLHAVCVGHSAGHIASGPIVPLLNEGPERGEEVIFTPQKETNIGSILAFTWQLAGHALSNLHLLGPFFQARDLISIKLFISQLWPHWCEAQASLHKNYIHFL